jgi:hypothetical protein
MEGLKRLLSSRKIAAMLVAMVASLLVFAASAISKKADIDLGLDKETAIQIAGALVSLAAVYAGAQSYEDGAHAKANGAVEEKRLDVEKARLEVEKVRLTGERPAGVLPPDGRGT